ncbi:hypothetical protein [Mycobacterium sp. E740]|uniref:hypothetical protein n=1 Tax=Mycobacterium sp. E740 TaxID=1834149 RepID=UPI0007FBDB31|nr:hypothetical protein [Mycobacterium sp. E740]OBI79349.1 hypothetical protein A5663_19400 [Mycobacterium sp. E740]
MLIAAVLCLCAAAVTAGLGGWLLRRPPSGDPVRAVLRSVAPTQLAAATMLAAGGGVALVAEPRIAVVVLIVCVLGAVGTVATGCWQSAKAVAIADAQRAAASSGGCGGACAGCTLSCS